MFKRFLPLSVLMIVLVSLFLSGCLGEGKSTPYPSQVEWDTAVEILNSGEVEMVAQLHSLEVILTLKDGTEIRTVEPSIDLIFQEVEQCGQTCRGIVLATE